MNEKVTVYDGKMTKTLNNLDAELATIRAGRANPHVLDKLTVDYYGSPTPIQQVANVSVPEARMIQIQPWEKKMLKEIEKAIQMRRWLSAISAETETLRLRNSKARRSPRTASRIWKMSFRS